ncbi:MAG: OB-fold nucleic acid binding domain-containing protein [Nanoarchaeota archaeon]|nr:OB-fold nucleic acid binding domain-containing protein [Nanoarchaeota archaeon]
MADQDQFKRHIAFKFRIGDLLKGIPIINEERFSYLELDGKRIVRVNVVGNITERYDNEGEKKYTFMTLDDGSGQLKIKAFGDDLEKLTNLNQGQTILVIGVLRSFNNELYITPEIVKDQDPKYLLIRKMESEKNRPKDLGVPKEQIVAVKDKILGKIKNSGENGIDVAELKQELKEISPNIVDQEIQKFLEEGMLFEPRPGIIKYLG